MNVYSSGEHEHGDTVCPETLINDNRKATTMAAAVMNDDFIIFVNLIL